jgi:hypothetical protein
MQNYINSCFFYSFWLVFFLNVHKELIFKAK